MSSDYTARLELANSLMSYATYHIVDLPLTRIRLLTAGHKNHNQQYHIEFSLYSTTYLPRRTPEWLCTNTMTPTPLFWQNLLQQPRTNTVTASHAFTLAAARIWNSLPVSITVSVNYCTFKTSRLKLTYCHLVGQTAPLSFFTNYVAV